MLKRPLLTWSHTKNETSKKMVALALFLAIITVLGYINYQLRGGWEKLFGVYGSIMVSYLLAKMLLSFFYKTNNSTSPDLTCDIIIPSYNESPLAVLTTVQSAILQSRPPETIFFVDDGSPSQASYQAMQKFKAKYDEAKQPHHPELIVHRLEENQGKRAAQSWAFIRSRADILMTVDSDSTLAEDAIHELIKPFADETVMATTGKVSARNRSTNLFTKLIDMRYDNAFRVERAAQSVTKNVLVCSGPLSCYRREVVVSNIEHYNNQHFLGVKVQAGDDRCLTNYAIARGKTVFQDSAVCYTDVPEKLKQFIKQQIRWNRSFFRESLMAIVAGKQKPAVLAWVGLEMTLWLLFGFVVLAALAFQVVAFGYVLLVYYLAAITLSAYARNVHYALRHPLIFLAAPLYGIIHLTLLFPLRLYALATIRTSEWGTREVKDTIFKPSFWQAYVYHMALFGIGLQSVAKGSYNYTKATALHAVRPVTLLMTNRYRKTQDAFVNVYENESTRFAEWNKYIQRLDKSSTKSLYRQYRALQRFDNFFIVRQYLPILYNDEIGVIPHSSHKNDLAVQHASSIA